ncbi:SGNH/GDSL hydrolase family protein [Paraurantiacibacter namhicola]|uniref:SGNH hydrolase-type esterase domain-containing protein n=1 Tax=Paraurantiacibacter namhicola TaxID=645517 RepID=A0A1C7D7U7_9SPHN|nr:SGNH/GDSL hydrolase family protein [Paraurantiacibacter namhicola]ANU07528.1 hypothetical protein A6F65_01221 [Paraurantiacibacter namhicola]
MSGIWQRIGAVAVWSVFALVVGVAALSVWAVAPYSMDPHHSARTAKYLAKAPFADRIVIGDSRIQYLGERPEALMMGYSSGQTWQIVRIAKLACLASDAPVSIALGVNDAKHADPATSRQKLAIAEIVEACGDRPTYIAEVWPAELGVEPAGGDYDPQLVAVIDRQARQAAARFDNVEMLPVPPLPDNWTVDGVHFTPEVDELYVQALTQPL